MKIISAESYRHAQIEAITMGLRPNEWRYVQWGGDDRAMRLVGVRAKPEDLIGPFTEVERFILTLDTAAKM
jgi:hypothetical protein